MNPLHQAIIKRDQARVAELLAQGADTGVLSRNGRNAFEVAEFTENLPAMVLLAGPDILHTAADNLWCAAIRRGDYGLADIPPARLNDALCDALLLVDSQLWSALPETYRQPANLQTRCLKQPALVKLLPHDLIFQPEFYQPLLTELKLSHWPRPWPAALVATAIELDVNHHYYLQDGDYTPAIAQRLIASDGSLLYCIPEALRDADLCRLAMTRGYDLGAVPAAAWSDELVPLALASLARAGGGVVGRPGGWQASLSADSLARVPEPLRSYEICLNAVTSNYQALAWVPQQYRDVAMCVAALEGRELIGMQIIEILEQVPEAIRTTVEQQANFTHHIQPGEYEDWDLE
ncbi:hypothetical protein [Halioxenophilus sp. WMMB6]|uniref:hypothetical protein n=1 Tax=Halioxenophilus sp. WMMB6 TaxID=3073815 RepID=UPI00295F20D3|nr:hypothetical protein [Halioxenophilus sp. WMMB6]